MAEIGANYFQVSSGLLTAEHRRRIGSAIWEFLWLIDHHFKPKGGEPDQGLVMNGDAITAARIATDLGAATHTVQINLRCLESEGYIRTVGIAGKGKRVFISNPKRWLFGTLAKNVQATVATLAENCQTP